MSTGRLRRDSVWWGWGRDHDRPGLDRAARGMLEAEIGPAEPAEHVALNSVSVPPPGHLPEAVATAAGGAGAVSTDFEDRVRHAAGKSYPDLVRIRSGEPRDAPDAVLAPADAEAVAATLAACAAERVAVVPFGGGTSVVGGVEPLRDGFDLLVALDMTALRSCEVDQRSLTATLGAGLRGAEAEALLNDAGFTLGHFPQSFAYATIGGFAATRSAGQASSGYGRFDSLVTSVRMQTPVGTIGTLPTPHTAAGPALRELLIGSEGTLGAITDVTVRVRPAPEARRYEAWVTPSLGDGIEIARSLAQGETLPDVFRLSDGDETRVSLALSGLEGLRRKALDAYLGLRRRSEGCIVIAGWEGEREAVARRRELGAARLRAGGAAPLGRRPGEAWQRGRYEGPYLRDALMDEGVLTDTLETSHLYGRIDGLYEAVRSALIDAMAAAGTPGIVLCHVSHVYRDGASLYFTFLCARRPGEEVAQWQAIKRAACEAIVARGGTITHHHGVGLDHAPYMRAEVGDLGLEALRGMKERLDPAGVMNPGKLLPR